MIRKTLLTLNRAEIVDTESIEAYAEYSSILRSLLWINFGLVLPLAAFGAWQTRRDWRRRAVLYAMAAALVASVVAFFVLARYRYPMMPIVLLFAAAGIASILKVTTDWRASLPGVAAAFAAAVICYLPIKTDYDNTQYSLGWHLNQAGRPADAIAPLEKAIAASPDYAPAHLNLGIALDQVGEKQRAIDELSIAATLRPADVDAQRALAICLREARRTTEALPHFEAAARLQPDSAPAQSDLGNALLETGNGDQALRHYRAALALDPAYVDAHANMGLLLRMKGNVREAVLQFREALRLDPGGARSAQMHYLIAEASAREGRLADALQDLREARPLALAANQADTLREIDQAIAILEKSARPR
jgi:tetratricopeptide (TPR) repeat protein